jgi:periplasmic protein TonB
MVETDAINARMHETPGPKLPATGSTEGSSAEAPASSNASPAAQPASEHALHVRPDRPVDISFSFESQKPSVGIGASVVAHIIMGLIVFLVLRYAPEAVGLDPAPEVTAKDIVWLSDPGPGGGGGGGGNRKPDPPRKAELPGKEKVTVPTPKPEPRPEPPKEDTPPPIDLNIPAKSMADAQQPLIGALKSEAATTDSQGPGSGGGAGTGTGTGVGSGQGSGLGPGFGGGTGGGAYRPGSGVTLPRALREVKPAYTAEAMRAKVQGMVLVECIVMPDGNVGDAKIIRSLDSVFGLDQEALKAARQWKFLPGTRLGEPVPVIITIELTFTLR